MYVTLIGCNLKNVCINDVCQATDFRTKTHAVLQLIESVPFE